MATVAKSSIAPASTPTYTDHPSTETPSMSQFTSPEHASTFHPSHRNHPFPSSLLRRRKSSINNLKAEEAEIASEINTHWPDDSFIHNTSTINSPNTMSRPLPIPAESSPHSTPSNHAAASAKMQSETTPPQTQPHPPQQQHQPQLQHHEYPYRRSFTTSSLGSPSLDMHDSILNFTDTDGRYNDRSEHYNLGQEGHFHRPSQQQQQQHQGQHESQRQHQHQVQLLHNHSQQHQLQPIQPNKQHQYTYRRSSTTSSLNSSSSPAAGLDLHDSILTFIDADGHYGSESEHHALGEEGHFHHRRQQQQGRQ